MARASGSGWISKSKTKSVEPVEEEDELHPNEDGKEEGEPEQVEFEDEKTDDPPGGDDESEDGDEEEGGEYEVEAIIEHEQVSPGKFAYLVSWKGYGPEHNTWEPQAHLDHATALLSKYWSTRNTKPTKAVPAPSNKRGRPSKGKAPAHQPPAKMAKTTNTRPKRAAPRRAYDGPANTDDTYQDDLSKYLDVEDWEDLVQSVDTMERGPDGTLLVFMTMAGGEKGGMATEVVYRRCPQKVLKFYEDHLKWKKLD